jgi:hypothetical protein
MGDRGFDIIKTTCESHDACANDKYCDSNGDCFRCEDCLRERDAFDGACPQKCGGGDALAFGQRVPDVSEEEASGAIFDFVRPGCPSYADLVTLQASATLAFASSTATSTPNRMSSRLARALQTLASTVRTSFGGEARLLVLRAYETPPAVASTATLHHEGRAADLDVANVPASFQGDALARLGSLAVQAGFDYVAYDQEGHISVSVIRDQCSLPLDLVFVLDGSASVDLPQYGGTAGNFARMLKFVEEVIRFFDVGAGKSQTRISAVTFSSSVTVNFDFQDYTTKEDIIAAVRNISYPAGATLTSQALATVRQQIFTLARGARPIGSGASRVAMVMTDGEKEMRDLKLGRRKEARHRTFARQR